MMAEPPLEAGAVHVTTDWRLAAEEAVTAVGAPGTVGMMMLLDAADAAPEPRRLVAVTVNV